MTAEIHKRKRGFYQRASIMNLVFCIAWLLIQCERELFGGLIPFFRKLESKTFFEILFAVLSDGVAFAQVADTIRALAIPELRSIETADLFRGGKLPAGKFSLMIRVTFQSGETTFTDAQISEFSARIVSALETKLGAVLRAS